MPVQPATSLARLLSSLPLPDAPYEIIARQNPETAQYLRRLHTYLLDLVSKFATAEVGGIGGLPPGIAPCMLVIQKGGIPTWLTVPDETKDYIPAYDHIDTTIKWIETTTDCTPP